MEVRAVDLNTAEKEVLDSFNDGDTMTLKDGCRKDKKNESMGRQSVWYALQLLVARSLVKKVDRGGLSKGVI